MGVATTKSSPVSPEALGITDCFLDAGTSAIAEGLVADDCLEPELVAEGFLEPKLVADDVHFIMEILVFFEDGFELAARIEHRGVVAAGENVPDAFVGVVHLVLQEVHGDLAGDHVFLLAFLAEDGLLVDAEMFADRADQLVVARRGIAFAFGEMDAGSQAIPVHAGGNVFQGRGRFVELVFRDDLIEDAFEFPDVGMGIVGDVFRDFLGKDKFPGTGFFLEYGESGLKIRHPDIHDDPPFETALETRLEFGQFPGGTVSRKDDLPSGLVHDVENVVEHFLGLGLVSEKLHVIDDEHVDGTVFFLESVDGPLFDGRDVIREEPVRGRVDDFFVLEPCLDGIASTLEEVGFPESDVPVDIEGIIGGSRSPGHGFACREGELVGWSYDEIVEPVFVIDDPGIDAADFVLDGNFFFLSFFGEVLVFLDAVDDEGIAGIFDVAIDLEFDTRDFRHELFYRFEDFLAEFVREVVPHERGYDPEYDNPFDFPEIRDFFEIGQKILLPDGLGELFDDVSEYLVFHSAIRGLNWI